MYENNKFQKRFHILSVHSVTGYTMEPTAVGRGDQPNAADDDWPICENVLRSLSEDVRPTASCTANDGDDAAVAANVRSCLAERVVPTADHLWRHREREERRRRRQRPSERDRITAAARRTQTRLMGVRSAYVDGAYYASGTSYVSRTVEELSPWTADAAEDVVEQYTYTVGTVLYDNDTGACHLHGFADPRSRVAVDCGPLTAALPRHRSTVKMYSVLRTAPADDRGNVQQPVLVPHHFQVFSCADAFR